MYLISFHIGSYLGYYCKYRNHRLTLKRVEPLFSRVNIFSSATKTKKKGANLRFSSVRSISKDLVEVIKFFSFRERASDDYSLSSAITLTEKSPKSSAKYLVRQFLNFSFCSKSRVI